MTKTGFIGARDESHVVKQQGFYPELDLGEIASRISGVWSFNRSGSVLMDVPLANGTSGWFVSLASVDSYLRPTNVAVGKDGIGLQLCHFGDSSPYSEMWYFFDHPSATSLGLELWFATGSGGYHLSWGVEYYTGAHVRVMAVRYNETQKSLDTWTTAGWQSFASDVQLKDSPYGANLSKLVFDLTNERLHRVYLNDKWWDLSGYSSYLGGSALGRHFTVWVQGYLDDLGFFFMTLTNLVITTNEPLLIC